MPLPNIPHDPVAGEPITPWAVDITQAVRAIAPTSSPDIRVQVTPQGTSYHIKDQARNGHRENPDEAGFATAKTPDGRKTIARNKETVGANQDSHAGEWQMHNVHLVRDQSFSMPFFQAGPYQGWPSVKISGEMYWGALDAHETISNRADNPMYFSLQAVAPADDPEGPEGKWRLQIYGFADSTRFTVPYAHPVPAVGDAGRQVTWRWPVTLATDPRATAPGTAAVIASITGGSATGSFATATVAARNLTVDRAALDIEAAGTGTLLYIPVTVDWSAAPATRHTDQTFSPSTPGQGGQNADHDLRYLQRSTNWAAAPGVVDGVNVCTGIALDSAGQNAINFSAAELYGLTATAPYLMMNYANGWLYNTWYAQHFQVGTSLPLGTYPGGKVRIYGDSDSIEMYCGGSGGIIFWDGRDASGNGTGNHVWIREGGDFFGVYGPVGVGTWRRFSSLVTDGSSCGSPEGTAGAVDWSMAAYDNAGQVSLLTRGNGGETVSRLLYTNDLRLTPTAMTQGPDYVKLLAVAAVGGGFGLRIVNSDGAVLGEFAPTSGGLT